MIVLYATLLGLAFVLFAAGFFCLVMGFRWKRRHGEPTVEVIDPELTRFGNPFSPVRREADRVLREGVAAERSDVAYAACRLANRSLKEQHNVWFRYALPLILLAQLPNMVAQSVNLFDEVAALSLTFGGLVAGMALVVIGMLVSQKRARRRARRTLELNRDLADVFEADHGTADGLAPGTP
ncbi:hypothetical protein [Nocardiopsis nanhaiensis]